MHSTNDTLTKKMHKCQAMCFYLSIDVKNPIPLCIPWSSSTMCPKACVAHGVRGFIDKLSQAAVVASWNLPVSSSTKEYLVTKIFVFKWILNTTRMFYFTGSLRTIRVFDKKKHSSGYCATTQQLPLSWMILCSQLSTVYISVSWHVTCVCTHTCTHAHIHVHTHTYTNNI